MKNKVIILLILVAAVFTASAYLSRSFWLHYTPWGTREVKLTDGAKNDKCKTVYTCPMHHQVIRDSPGNCPICGMTLVKKEIPEKGMGNMSSNMSSTPGLTPEEQALKTVTLDPRERMLANVATTEVREESISQEVDTVGKIAVDEQNIRKISSWYAGRIEKLAVNFTGQYVRKGQELFTIYSPEMVATQKEYLIAKASAARLKSSDFPEVASGSEGVLDAAKTRMKLWGLTDAQIHRLDATGQVNNTISVYSPVSGTVTDIKAREGDYVAEGSEVFTVSDLSRVWMEAEVYEYEFSKVSLGSRVEVTAEAYPGRVFSGTVSFIDPSVNPQSRTVRVRANMSNKSGMLKPEMFVTAKIMSKPVRGVVVPASAVLYTGNGNVAWVEEKPNVFTMRSVTPGLRSGDDYQILAGLKPGEHVVTEGGFLIDSEAQLEQSAGGGMANMPGMETGKGKSSPEQPPAKQTMPGMNM
ncbi:MAG: efflux RND transporter periplasmic adaptor subunit [Nitrospirota bacterium]